MATRTVSPGGALLRSSRLFSLPSQLPPPPIDATGFMVHSSGKSTAAFPTLQTLSAPQGSRSRGDWGLKRALPRKLVSQTSNPVVRIKHVDSAERFTDYAVASDHLLALQKWQEMNMPITVRPAGSEMVGKSVFEEHSDITALESGSQTVAESGQWKFKGPWLAGMDRGAFQTYVKNRVRVRRNEFTQFLKKHLAEEANMLAQSQALDAATAPPAARTADDITDDQVFEYLRNQRLGQARTTLYHLVGKFLDLAPVAQTTNANRKPNPYAKEGPPMTHPSAGLSYLRTDAYLDNHPIYGPQQHHPPVEARVMAPRGFRLAKVGVGGFIADSPGGEASYNVKTPGSSAQEGIDPSVLGGHKRFVHPGSATVNSTGGIILTVKVGDEEAALVKKELEGQSTLFVQGSDRLASLRVGSRSPVNRMLRSNMSNARGSYVLGNSQSYGIEV